MDFQSTLSEIRPHLDLCCWNAPDASALIQAAALAAQFELRRISVDASSVASVWSWLEKSRVALSAMVAWNSDKADAAALARDITAPLKRGADSVQLFVRWKDLPKAAEALREIKSEIFFDKKLSVALSLDEAPYDGWPAAFDCMDDLAADNIMLIAKNIKTAGQKYYSFLDALDAPRKWGIEVCVASDAVKPLEDLYRLTNKMLPDGMNNLRMIVRPEFMKNFQAVEHEDL